MSKIELVLTKVLLGLGMVATLVFLPWFIYEFVMLAMGEYAAIAIERASSNSLMGYLEAVYGFTATVPLIVGAAAFSVAVYILDNFTKNEVKSGF